MRNTIRSIAALSTLLLVFGCSTGGDGDGGGSGTNPTASALLFPLNNSECLAGTSVSETESKINFEWNASENADSYIVYVKNLTTQLTFQYNAGTATSLEIQLTKGTPYSWYVVAKSSAANSTNATSEKWKFYNAGNGVVNYAPFPADVIAPLMSSSISTAAVNFKWEASDIDSDIVEYKVYLGSNPTPTSLIGTVTTKNLDNITVTANTTYYWKVVTKDSAGNTSDSPIFQFKTL